MSLHWCAEDAMMRFVIISISASTSVSWTLTPVGRSPVLPSQNRLPVCRSPRATETAQ